MVPLVIADTNVPRDKTSPQVLPVIFVVVVVILLVIVLNVITQSWSIKPVNAILSWIVST